MDGETLQNTVASKLARKNWMLQTNRPIHCSLKPSRCQRYRATVSTYFLFKTPQKDTPYNIKHWACHQCTLVNYDQTWNTHGIRWSRGPLL